MLSQPSTAATTGCASAQAHEHLWNEEFDKDKDASPTAARAGKRKVSSAAAALDEAKRARKVEVIDLTGDEPPAEGAKKDTDNNNNNNDNNDNNNDDNDDNDDKKCSKCKGPKAANGTRTTTTLPSTEPAAPPVGSVRSAWLNAAMAWRQKNMPSASELRRRKADAAARSARESKARKIRAKEYRFRAASVAAAAAEQERQRMNAERERWQRQRQQQQQQAFAADPSIVRPEESASLEEWQAFYRSYHGSRIRNAASFVQVLRAFDIPCDDPKKIKVSYMQAVRMYHPDSNSKTRTFTNERDRMEAEEIMKLINQRKPDQF